MKKNENIIYKVLDNPSIFRLSQALLAPGGVKVILNYLKELLSKLPAQELLIDVGCGPLSWLQRMGLKPIGIDFSFIYLTEFIKKGTGAIQASAEFLPIASDSIGGVWSFLLFHHLPDDVAKKAINELVRIRKSSGYTVIVDGILPDSFIRSPIAYLIRRMDRGDYMRNLRQFELLLPQREKWSVQKFKYSLMGFEMIVCVLSS